VWSLPSADCWPLPALAGHVWGDLSAYPEPLSRDAQTLGFSKAKLLHQVLSRGFNVVTAEPDTVFVHEVAGVFERWFEGSAADMAAATHELASGKAGHTMVDFGAMAVLSRNSTIAMFKEMADKTVNLGWTAEDAFNNMAFDYWSFCHTRSTCWAARRARTHGGAGSTEKVALAPLPWLSSNYSSCLRPLGDTFCSNRRLFLRGLCVEVGHSARLLAAPPCAPACLPADVHANLPLAAVCSAEQWPCCAVAGRQAGDARCLPGARPLGAGPSQRQAAGQPPTPALQAD
jgi:hypothetical protein